jgi:hypothetical protein
MIVFGIRRMPAWADGEVVGGVVGGLVGGVVGGDVLVLGEEVGLRLVLGGPAGDGDLSGVGVLDGVGVWAGNVLTGDESGT